MRESIVRLHAAVAALRPELASELASVGVASCLQDTPVPAADNAATCLKIRLEADGLASSARRADDVPTLVLAREYDGAKAALAAARGELLLPLQLPSELLLPVVQRLASRADPIRSLAQRFALSPQETRLVQCLESNCSSEEMAERLGCNPTTLSTYWNRVFRKMGTRTQRGVLVLCIDALRRTLL